MNIPFSKLLFSLFLASTLWMAPGCGDDSGGTDTGGTDSGGSDAGTDSGGSDVAAAVTFADVHPIYAAKCMPCHTTGMMGQHSIGNGDIGTAFTSSQADSYSLSGESKGAATLLRIQNGTMPLGASCTGDPANDAANSACLTADEQAMIEAWIAGGQMQ